MKKLILNLTVFAAVVIITAFVFTAGAITTQYNDSDNTSIQQWEKCAEQTLQKYHEAALLNSLVFQKDFCEFLGAPVGQECDSLVQMMYMSDDLQEAVLGFSFERVIIPACGKPPGE